MRYVTAAQMKEIDRYAIQDCGIAALTLMENAGRAVAEEAKKIAPMGDAIVFAGYGNNGGDGLVAARHLLKDGHKVKVFFAGKPKSLSPETNSNLESLLKININPQFIANESDIENILGKMAKPGIIIDAIFGIGIKGTLEGFYIKLVEEINNIGAPIISVDIPSGLDADSGKPLPAAIKAHTTVTFGYPKAGFKDAEASGYVGKLIVADIGFPEGETGVNKGKELKNKTIRLRTGRSGAVRSGHPWIFRSQISKAASGIKPGDIVAIQTADGKFIGRGYYNPRSEISVRLLTFKDEAIDSEFFGRRFKEALEKRKRLICSRAGFPALGNRTGGVPPKRSDGVENLPYCTNAYRAVFSEADGLPGLIVDMYNDTAVFQILTLGMEKLKPIVLEAMREALKPLHIYEKSESPFRKLEGLKDIRMWCGDKGETVIEIFEGKAKFFVDIENGHKTGFYLDQRRSRLALENISKGKKVLDLFCYTGAFSVTAAIYGASETRGVDTKKERLDLAEKNAQLNGVSQKVKFEKSDAFGALKKIRDSGEKFDIVIIDPPSFLKTRESIKMASRGYAELNTLGMKILNDGGALATFSCSHNMPGAVFSEILKKSAIDANRSITILKRCHQDIDHPIVRAIPETEYLKGYFLRVAHP